LRPWGYGYWWPYLVGYGLGYGGWGGYGWGYPYYGYASYGYNPSYYNYNPGYGGYGYSSSNPYGGYYPYGGYDGNAYAAMPTDQEAPPDQTAAADDGGGDYASRGEADFRSGDYQAAARDWKHAMVDDPQNGAVMLLLAQALFQTGQYEQAAGAVQMGMQMLPEDKWGTVVSNYTQLYGNMQDYTDQVRALEKARDNDPENPAYRFLLGYHFGYLGYPKQAVRQLDKAMQIQPKDLGSKKLRDIFTAKLPAGEGASSRPPATPPQPSGEERSNLPPPSKNGREVSLGRMPALTG
jgi:tetratricopeptide (TPR) repeat protein